MECFEGDGSFLPPVTEEQLWDRLKRFLDDVRLRLKRRALSWRCILTIRR